MPDTVVKIYLHFIVWGSLLFVLLIALLLFTRRHRSGVSSLRKRLWINVFFFATGVLAWFLFSYRLLDNWLVMLCTSVMLVISVYVAGALAKDRVKER